MWTRFMDMHSGGGLKEKWQYIYIEAPKKYAIIIFYNRFRHNPNRVTCTCCGGDYSISEYKSLKQATAYDRGCEWSEDKNGYVEKPSSKKYSFKKYAPLNEYLKSNKTDVLVIYAKDIKPEEKNGEVPSQGYVWVK